MFDQDKKWGFTSIGGCKRVKNVWGALSVLRYPKDEEGDDWSLCDL